MSYFTETFDVALSKITEDKRLEFAKDVMYAGKMGALYGVVGASMAENTRDILFINLQMVRYIMVKPHLISGGLTYLLMKERPMNSSH